MIDEQVGKFLSKYSTEELATQDVITVFATDFMMPHTTLSEAELARVDEILSYITNSEWDRYMSDDDINQSRNEFNVARWAGEEWFSSRDVFLKYAEGLKASKGVGKGSWNGEHAPTPQVPFSYEE